MITGMNISESMVTAGRVSPVRNDAPAANTARSVERRFIQNATYGCRVKESAMSPMLRARTKAMNQKGVKKAFVVVTMVVLAAEAAGTIPEIIVATMSVEAIPVFCMIMNLRVCR